MKFDQFAKGSLTGPSRERGKGGFTKGGSGGSLMKGDGCLSYRRKPGEAQSEDSAILSRLDFNFTAERGAKKVSRPGLLMQPALPPPREIAGRGTISKAKESDGQRHGC